MAAERESTAPTTGLPGTKLVRCAIYTRKSTDEGLEQAFNTLDAQREAAEAYINSQRHEGWMPLPQKYDDGGYTGANMDRPALKRLLADIESGIVNCVVVYKVDRLTRSLLDFARIIEVLDKRGATFVSVTQQFNTTNSLGRLTLNVLLSFAQFEREMISERTRDKMSAARRKGKWVGGNLILGYDVAPEGGAIVVNHAEAERVREIFRLYLEYGSLIPVVEELTRRDWRMKSWTTREGRRAGGKPFVKNTLYNLLTNMTYVGKVRYAGTVYEGEHDRIIDEVTWNGVQLALAKKGRRGERNVGNKHGALLKGLARCASCDLAMIHTYVKKKTKLYRYYVCIKANQSGWAQCATRSVSAPVLEEAVLGQLRGLGNNPTVLRGILRELELRRQKEIQELQRKKTDLEWEMRAIAREMSEVVALSTAASRFAELQERSQTLDHRHSEILTQLQLRNAEAADPRRVEETLLAFDPLWEQLSTWERESFIRSLVDRIQYDGPTGNITLAFRSTAARDLCNWAAGRLMEKV